MAESVYVPSTLKEGYFSDLPAPVAGDDARPVTYNHATLSFVYSSAFATAAQLTAHAAVTSGVHGISAFAATFLDDTSQGAVQSTLGLVIGTNIQAYNANLAALAGLTGAADRMAYFTGVGALALATFTAKGREVAAAADAAAIRTAAALGTIATEAETGYILATGARTGASSQAQAFTNGLTPHTITGADVAYGGDVWGLVLGTNTTNQQGRIAHRGGLNLATYNAFFENDVQKWTFGNAASGLSPNSSFFITSSTYAASSIIINQATGYVGIAGVAASTAALDIAASTTARASLRLRTGVAPTSPNAGDMWTDGADFYGRGAASYSFGAVVRTTAIRPLADSTTALQMQNAAGTAIVTVDTTNQRLGVLRTPTATVDFGGSATSSTGDIVLDAPGKTLYIGRLSPTGSDSLTSFIFRNRLGSKFLELSTFDATVKIGEQTSAGNVAPIQFFTDGAEVFRLTKGGNAGFNVSTQFGSGVGVIGILNATTVPTTNPTGGGVLYVESGSLKFRGSSGTVTVLAAA